MSGHPVQSGWQGSNARTSAADDARLMSAIRAGDMQAFETLYRNYHPRLTRFLSGLIRRPQAVEEVLDDTMMAVWEKPDSFRGESRLSTWIFAIAYRKAMKSLRRWDDPLEDHEAAAAYAVAEPSVKRLMTLIYATCQRPEDCLAAGPVNLKRVEREGLYCALHGD